MWKIPQGTALLAQARKLGVSMDDILTTDGQQLAYVVLSDFTYTLKVTTTHKKGERIRDLLEIDYLRKTGSSRMLKKDRFSLDYAVE